MPIPSEILALLDVDEITVLIEKTLTQWTARVVSYGNAVTVPIVVTPPIPVVEVLEVVTNQLNVRAAPTVNSADVGDTIYFVSRRE